LTSVLPSCFVYDCLRLESISAITRCWWLLEQNAGMRAQEPGQRRACKQAMPAVWSHRKMKKRIALLLQFLPPTSSLFSFSFLFCSRNTKFDISPIRDSTAMPPAQVAAAQQNHVDRLASDFAAEKSKATFACGGKIKPTAVTTSGDSRRHSWPPEASRCLRSSLVRPGRKGCAG
jgi:hypothetical protein